MTRRKLLVIRQPGQCPLRYRAFGHYLCYDTDKRCPNALVFPDSCPLEDAK